MAVNVLFVCLGNICRSTMAEAVMRHQVEQAGLSDRIIIDSAGTGNYHIGEPPHKGTRAILDLHGISHAGITARQIAREDLDRFAHVIAMDEQNHSDILRPVYRIAARQSPFALRFCGGLCVEVGAGTRGLPETLRKPFSL